MMSGRSWPMKTVKVCKGSYVVAASVQTEASTFVGARVTAKSAGGFIWPHPGNGMNNRDLLDCRRLPARLCVSEVSVLLNLLPYEVVTLTRLGLLRPLGSPRQNSRRW